MSKRAIVRREKRLNLISNSSSALTQNFGDSLVDPWLDHGQIHIFQIDLLQQIVGELQLLQQFLVFVGKSVVLLCGGASEESGICHPKFGRSRRSSPCNLLT